MDIIHFIFKFSSNFRSECQSELKNLKKLMRIEKSERIFFIEKVKSRGDLLNFFFSNLSKTCLELS